MNEINLLFKHLLIDMDGVLWRGQIPMPGLADFFECLSQKQVKFMLVTNNASKTPEHYAHRLAGYGVNAPPSSIITSALATADYVAEQCVPDETPVYVVGMDGLRQALSQRGFPILNHDTTPGEARYVVVGFDAQVTYEKLAQATLHIRAGAQFIGTNPDRTFPGEQGLLPGAGSILAALEAATDVEPTVIGKPSPLMFQVAMQRIGADVDTTAMIGDKLGTDIAGGQTAGLYTILLLSGVTTRQELHTSSIQPTLVFEDIAAFTQSWSKNGSDHRFDLQAHTPRKATGNRATDS